MVVGLGPELCGLLRAGLRGKAGTDDEEMSKQIAVSDEPGARPLTDRLEQPAFQLLGPLQVAVSGQLLPLGPDREQRLLVALLSDPGVPVTHGRLMEAIWDDIPKSAAEDLYHLVCGLRKRLSAALGPKALAAGTGIYRLDVPAAWVDVHRFHDLSTRARRLTGGEDEQAVALLDEALRLHRGEPLAGLRGRWIDGYRHLLTEERRAAELALNEAAIRAGEARERIPRLNSLFRDRPGDEWVAWLYMHALYRAGRQQDALEVWHTVTRHLDATIAAASLTALSDLYQRILRQDDDLFRPEAVWFPAGEAGARARGRRGAGQDPREQEPNGAAEAPHESAHDEEPASDADGGHAPNPQTTLMLNGQVNAPFGVFGTQINYGRPL